ncbi:MAG: DUF255 domain-containing protein, partial [Proteobacteria bacterium]|nr:DUF255 domain-containing protein [Pseudomonadota bacterium]
KWSNYCKKMSEELLNDSQIVEIINKNFIPILVNRDERPDIDAIYQKASYIIGQGSGWPLNLILNHDGKPFAGINYKTDEDKDYFITMLSKVLELFNTNRDKISQRAQTILDAIKPIELAPSELREEIIHNPEEDIVNEMDFEYGGLKKNLKFPPFAHIDLLLWKYWIRPKPWVFNAIEKTLKGMVHGGIYDNLEGGFHRYCVDKEWRIPHFEKIVIDNAWHIINFLYAYSILKDDFYREIAIETIDYIKKNLLSTDGFFCASQFADDFYYTWEESELQRISDMTITLVDGGAMVNGRFVLIGRDRELIKQLKDKLILERKKRPSPEVDSELYAYVNGICSEAFILAWRKIKDRQFLNIALTAIDRTLLALLKDGNFYRTVEGTPALIDDYAYMISALISAYEVTAEKKYLEETIQLMDLALQKLWDKHNGGFYDSPEEILSIRQKNIHDTFYPSSNSIMIINLLKLNAITKDDKFLSLATLALKAFSNTVSAYLSPYYVKAVLSYFDLLTLNFYTNTESNIGRAAIQQITPFTVIAHRENTGDYIIPSVGKKQFEPIKEPEDLAKFLKL